MKIICPKASLEFDVPVTSAAKWVRELMSSDYVQLSWSEGESRKLPSGSYIKYKGVKYTLTDDYQPKMETAGAWLYEPQFHSPESMWSKVPFFLYSLNGESYTKEIDWSLTGNASDFLRCVILSIKNETGENYSFVTDAGGSKSILFSSVDLFSALNNIANTFETEWWVDNKVIHLSKCKIEGVATTLTVGDNVGVPSVSEKSEGSYDRFYAFGSTRNIVQDYKGANVNNLVNKRLTLDPHKYPDGYYKVSDGNFSKILVYDDIYPAATNLEVTDLLARTDYVLDDTTQKRIQIGTDSNGEPIYDIYTVWYMRIQYKNEDGSYTDFEFNDWNYTEDTSVHGGKEGMLIPGLKVSVNFQTGALMGREFELRYIKHSESHTSASGTAVQVPAGYFEILYTKDNNYIIPDSVYLVPSNGDKVVLFNIKMPDIYISDAYSRLEERMQKDLKEKYFADLNQYSFPLWKALDFKIGSSVTYGSLETRIIGITERIDGLGADITIGNELFKGTIRQLVDDTANANQNIDIISTLNKTTETLANAYTRTYQEVAKNLNRISSMFIEVEYEKGKWMLQLNPAYDGLVVPGFLAAGSSLDGGGVGYTQADLEDIKKMTKREEGVVADAYAMHEMYDEVKSYALSTAQIEEIVNLIL